MSIHIGAKYGEIAETVLVSGDPLRAKRVAESMFQDAVCYTNVRNMLGYTGTFNGQQISVQGTGMGQASLAIYLHELIHEYGVKRIIRIGTCGSLVKQINLGDIILAQGACTDGSANRILFNGLDFAPLASFELLSSAYQASTEKQLNCHVGNVFSTDLFYSKDDPIRWKIWQQHQLLCAEMETSTLYTMAAGANVEALSILTVSDNIVTGEASSSDYREQSFNNMVELALSIV